MIVSNKECALRYSTAIRADLFAMARTLVNIGADSSATAFDVCDGSAIFLGHGLFVNRLIGLGLKQAPDPEAVASFEQQAASLGHAAAIDVSSFADPRLPDLLASRGYSQLNSVAVVARPVEGPSHDPSHQVERVEVESFDEWCDATASGWGHLSTERRSGSDQYARAAFACQDPGLFLARSADDGRVLGASALAIISDVALFGGMSTIPAERRAGVQASMITTRLRIAADRSCTLAATQVEPDSASFRNLVKAGFRSFDRIDTWGKASQ